MPTLQSNSKREYQECIDVVTTILEAHSDITVKEPLLYVNRK